MPTILSLPRVTSQPSTRLAADPAVRAVAAIGLITVGIIHALEIQGQLSGAVWLTAGFCLLAVVAPIAGLWLLARPTTSAWQFGGLLCLLAAAGYILTRSVPVPGDPGDVGNWLEPLGVAALITESVVVILAALALFSQTRSAFEPARHAGRAAVTTYE
ncbi:MAG TPA: hypothetical protein VLW50_24040 [Streptosporangiaceae bacterium]|nr:hypothetical protein [Streptosporangiaceae bacterium]